MYILTIRNWVCLISDTDLATKMAQRREYHKQHGGWMSFLKNRLWRQITINVTSKGLITLELMNVDQEAASGGYWSGGEACCRYTFTWDDLQDVESMAKLLSHEQVVVYHQAQRMLSALKEQMAPLRNAFKAFEQL